MVDAKQSDYKSVIIQEDARTGEIVSIDYSKDENSLLDNNERLDPDG